MSFKLTMRLGMLASLLSLGMAQPAWSQHPIEVERQAAKEEYLKALTSFDSLPKRRQSTEAVVAAARSAWALGLTDRAIALFEQAQRDESLPVSEQARVMLSRGIIEFQEGRFQVAALFAERAVQVLSEPTVLRARALSLWGESLFRLNLYGPAGARFSQALAECLPSERGELHYLLGRTQLRLAQFDDAQRSLEAVPIGHERTPLAVRLLAQLALDRKDYPAVTFWLTKARSDFPDYFLDSWVDYALMSAALAQDDVPQIEKLRVEAQKRYAPSDPWITLLNAAAEAHAWSSARASYRMPGGVHVSSK